MSRILLGQSYYLRFDPKLYSAMQPYAPLGTLYAASYLREHHHDVALFDAMLAEGDDQWDRALQLHQPRGVVLYEDNFNYLSKMCLLRMRAAAWRMIAAAKKRGCVVVLCGADATDHAGEYLKQGADYVIQGEGEETLGQLMDHIEGKELGPIENITGLSWLDSSGTERRNPPRPHLTDLDALPFPAWDLVDVPAYRSRWKARHGRFSMNMVTTRGCPYHCNWCAKPIWGQRYNSRSPQNAAAELEWLKAAYQPDHIWFADDIFGLKPGWIEDYGNLVRDRKVAIPFKCQMRADLVKPSVVEGLKAARCETVWLGAESGSQKILDAMEKGTTVAQIYQARRLLAAAGIRVAFFLQFGYPCETRSDIDLTLRMVRELMPDDIGISISYPLPGTSFYERVRAQLRSKQNWIDSDDLALLYAGPFPEAFYRTLYNAVHSEFRTRTGWQRIRRPRTQPRPGAGAWLRNLAAIPKNWLSWQTNQRRLKRFQENPPAEILSSEAC
jgi:anaerobic magnesium-protoporphyrin IX monomethyl ester cyclase